jgi:hypothetical protein
MTDTLTNFQAIWDAYPVGELDAVKATIGGAVNADWVTNTCVVRVSRALNYAGVVIPADDPALLTLKGADGKNYALRVREFKAYMTRVYGDPQITHVNGGQGGPVPAEIAGQRGILCFDVSAWADATGHFDLWDGQAARDHGYFDVADAVHLWTIPGGDDCAETPAAPVVTAPAQGPVISASVGVGGVNLPDDVKLVQTLLKAKGVDPGAVDGVMGPGTIVAIKAFQAGFMASPDGLVDVASPTLSALGGL